MAQDVFKAGGLSVTCKDIINKLTKANRKFDVVDDWRNAVLYCVQCKKRLGEYDMYYHSHEALKYCSDCAKQFVKEVPRVITEKITILEDYGTTVMIRYEDIRHEEDKVCYFSSKGRFVKIKGKRLYI